VIPNGWTLKKLRDVGDVCAGRQRSPNRNGRLRPYLRVANVFDGYIDCTDVLTMPFEDDEFCRYLLRPGDILLNEGQSLDLVGRSAIYRGEPKDCAFQNTLVRFRAYPETDVEFAHLLFQYLHASGRFSEIASRTTSIAHLGVDRFASLKVPLPAHAEQQAIARLLKPWNSGLLQLEQLIHAKRALKQCLIQLLLSGSRRLRGSKGRWRQFHLGQVTTEAKERNGTRLGTESVMAVNKRLGLVPMRERIIGKSIIRYKVVPPKAFAYNPMRLNIGSLVISNEPRDVLVSPDYVVFTCNEGQLDPDYLNHYRRTHAWTKFVEVAGNGSVRVRIYYKDLGTMKVNLPPFKEQQRIAEVLNTCDREIGLLQQQLEAFKSQKTGLMQKLLTGQIRTTR